MCVNKTIIRNVNKDGTLSIKCGKCFQCINAYINDWNVRVFYQTLQSQSHESDYFITLTLDDDNQYTVPSTRDLQLFFKSVRKNLRNSRFKYIAVSEYGEQYNRLHYHIILLNFPMSHLEFTYREIGSFLERSWNKGFIDVRPFQFGKISYTLRYQFKDKYNHGLEHIRLFSKGIGLQIPKHLIKFFNNLENFEQCTIRSENGANLALPRYYRKKYFEVETHNRFSNFWYKQNLSSDDYDNMNKFFNLARQNLKYFKDEKT